MADTEIKYGDVGLASFNTHTFDTKELFTGDKPVSHTPEIVASATISAADLPAFSVVGRNSSGEIVLAKTSTTAVKAIGITAATVKQGATNRNVPVYRSGCFNPAALNYHGDYDTAEKKRLAFEDSVDGTDIIIRGISG